LKRRKFIKKSTALFGIPCLATQSSISFFKDDTNEIDWELISKEFNYNSSYINLNTGSAGIMSKTTQAFLNQCSLEMGSTSPYQSLGKWQPIIKENKQRLADLVGVQTSELALVRNTTEAINLVLQGYPFNAKDEILTAKHDYPYVLNTLGQLSKLKKTRSNIIEINFQKATKDSIIQQYQKALTKNTSLLILTYIPHSVGSVLPIKEIIKIAHQNGTEVLVDAAHAFAHIPHNITELNCDYYATSLHKWLSAPYGNGLLYIKKDKIGKIQPICSSYENEEDSMKKFEHLGTRAFQNIVAIQPALDFLLNLKISNKLTRLQHLTKYWINRLPEIKNARLMSNTQTFDFGGMACFKIDGQSSQKIVNRLFEEHKIIAKSTGLPNGDSAIRISTNVFILEKHLDKMIEAVKEIVNS